MSGLPVHLQLTDRGSIRRRLWAPGMARPSSRLSGRGVSRVPSAESSDESRRDRCKVGGSRAQRFIRCCLPWRLCTWDTRAGGKQEFEQPESWVDSVYCSIASEDRSLSKLMLHVMTSSFTGQCRSFSPARVQRGSAERRGVVTAVVTGRDVPSGRVDCGRILGVGPNASKGDVKAAYRKLALQFHPDVCKGGECEVNFMEVNRAYESLMALPSTRGSSSSCVGEPASCSGGFQASERAPAGGHGGDGDDDDDPWAEFLQSLANGTHEQLQEDFSSYYSNLKCYGSKARRNRYNTYYQENW